MSQREMISSDRQQRPVPAHRIRVPWQDTVATMGVEQCSRDRPYKTVTSQRIVIESISRSIRHSTTFHSRLTAMTLNPSFDKHTTAAELASALKDHIQGKVGRWPSFQSIRLHATDLSLQSSSLDRRLVASDAKLRKRSQLSLPGSSFWPEGTHKSTMRSCLKDDADADRRFH
jgi:hypothetical protein